MRGPSRGRRWLSRLDDLLLVGVVASGSWWGYDRLVADHNPTDAAAGVEATPDGAVSGGEATEAIQTLRTLNIKGRAPTTGYSRERFGRRWIDVDRNGCDTRNDMPRRDLRDVQIRPATRGCVVESGTLTDPYTGEEIHFVKGNKTSTLVQIDHVVPLADAWQKGAQQWAEQKRIAFANDPLNLLAVGAEVNRRKKDGDSATWLPPLNSARCGYVARQINVKAKYELWVTSAERDAMSRVLESC